MVEIGMKGSLGGVMKTTAEAGISMNDIAKFNENGDTQTQDLIDKLLKESKFILGEDSTKMEFDASFLSLIRCCFRCN